MQVNYSYRTSENSIMDFLLGADAVESVKERAKESKKKATKKAKETAEETSEAAAKKKRRVNEL